MADSSTATASRWALGLVIYFLVYFLIVYGITSAQTELGLPTDVTMSGTPFVSYTADTCDAPRCAHADANGKFDGENCKDESTFSSLSCQWIATEAMCNGLHANECKWYPKTAYNEQEQCLAITGGSYVTPESLWYPASVPSNITTVTTIASLFNAELLYDNNANQMVRVSSTPLLASKTNCEAFGFTWYSAGTANFDSVSGKLDASTFMSALSAMFSFSPSFGLPAGLSLVFKIIFTYIPTIVLTLIAIMMLGGTTSLIIGAVGAAIVLLLKFFGLM